MIGRSRHIGLVQMLTLLLNVPVAHAQTQSAIAGIVKDTTGAVLPGVTVEAASPALIERTRSAVTDSTGQYRIIELRPGTYTVTFTLPGFNTVKREGVELTTAFTATINAELRVGNLAETVTVSGESPVVDTQNTLKQRVITRDVMDAVPSARNFATLGILIPGATVFNNVAVGRSNDVGGSAGNSDQTLSIHGGRGGDQRVLVDGMSTNLQEGLGGQTHFVFPHANIEELAIQIGAHSAEAETGGMLFNIIPKSGANRFNGHAYASFTNRHLLSSNLSEDLRARGLLIPDQIDYISDVNPSVGGPLLRDRLWFYGGVRSWRVMRLTAIFYDENPSDWVYTRDLSRGPVPYATPTWDVTGRVTWQASLRNKISANLGYAARCECQKTLDGTVMYEASSKTQFPARLLQASWVAPVTNKFLLDAGVSGALSDSDDRPQAEAVGPSARELSNGITFRAASIPNRSSKWRNYTVRAAASYVTGAHNFKTGVVFNPASTRRDVSNVSDYEVQLLNGVPNRVNYLATPYYDVVYQDKFALFAQDQWTVRRLTLNGGLRFDWLRTSYPDVDLVATRWLPARHFAGADVLNWKDLQPRLGAAYDLFGTGKTALKVSLSRYAVGDNVNTTRGISPSNASGGTLLRAWVDANGDFVPQGDPLNPVPNGELVGPSPNLNFGKPVLTLRLDPEWANGWNVRDYNWETSASIQHEVMPRVSGSVGYFRRWYGNFSVIDNLAVSPAAYDTFCITAPSDPRLPAGGGERICDLFDLNPSAVGSVDRIQTRASNYGKHVEYWQGVDVTVDARLPSGVLLQGGLSSGKSITDTCDIVTKVDNPSRRFCRSAQPLLTQLKFVGSYTLPARVQVAASLQSASGIIASGVAGGADYGIQANYVATNALIAPSLGRNLSAGPNGTVTVNLVTPGTMRLDRVNQLDLRFARTFSALTAKVKGMVDFYNLLNANPVVRLNYTYGTNGSTWLVPQNILLGRLVTFAAQFDF